MRYTIQHLVGSIVLIIAQATAFFMHEINIAIVFGLCQLPLGCCVRIRYSQIP